MEREFKNHMNALSPNTTYVVSENCTVANHLSIPIGVSLIFKGGIITITGKLTGFRTAILAPITQIFATSNASSIDGTWYVERAYPQWFGAKADNITDCSDAINKAILFKKTGEVFLPRGTYKITKTIDVKYGIILCGEKAINPVDIANNNLDARMGTVIIPSGTGFAGNFTIRMNTKGTNPENATWEIAYPSSLTAVKNILFSNHTTDNNMRGILCAGSFEVSHCGFNNFVQAVASAGKYYSDNKTVTDCHFFVFNGSQSSYFAFDLRGLGDNLCFKRNHIVYSNGLYLSLCNGGEISDNILNCLTKINISKGIVFSANHCEDKTAQLHIINSAVSVVNNFFQKNEHPSISIEGKDNDTSIVSISNCEFLYYDYYKQNNNTVIDGVSNVHDIVIGGKVSLKISNSFRYWVLRNSIGKTFIFGIFIGENNNSLLGFNNYSYFLSNDSLIKANKYIALNHSVQTMTDIRLYADTGGNEGIVWKRDFHKKYTYTYQILWDARRHIATSGTNTIMYTPTKGGLIMYFDSNFSSIGFQTLIRIFRESANSNEYVDVPICGTQYMYDNGDSICGFKWTSYTVKPELSNCITPIGVIEFRGKNLIMRSLTIPSSGTWENGDIVYNAGPSANTLWIRHNNSWISK
ncbi:glycosyl hydrolase family 28-related protein [Tannerella forsythia]|uniref:glycosyl hydrolase family 28-related protein n=1 Tax=Tannerella forsythia TaxID=28112 RepID=UPI0028E3EFBA|nr:glycosyl hydrolase family 28-related protein [Tannerella forsythia]